MIDLLLKFPDEATAGAIGKGLGCAELVDGVWQFKTTPKVAISPIGPHRRVVGMSTDSVLGPIPILVSDGNFWALARIMAEMPVPEVLTPFLVERDPADALQPQREWA